MPTCEINCCDNCGKEMDRDEKFLFYTMEFWHKTRHTSIKKDWLLDNNCALMLCSEKCIGEYFVKLLTIQS